MVINCIIIEDEFRSVQHLENQLALTGYEVNVLERIDTVEHAVAWLKNNTADIIFMDIQLGDGLSFEIFDHIQLKTPVIFTTSYNQYITKAFDVNSISYLLKPVNQEGLKGALEKFRFLYEKDTTLNDKIININRDHQKRFLVQSGSAMQSVMVNDVAYFQVQNKRFLVLTTKDRQQHLLDITMEILEQRLDPELFFRLNRQFIVNIHSIHKIHRLDKGRVRIETMPECKEEIIVSAEKSASFKDWLNS
jgi:two-component system response regulator LytT